VQNAAVREYMRRYDTVENIHEVISERIASCSITKASNILIFIPIFFILYIFPANINDCFLSLSLLPFERS